jgi:hypothetical protein
MALLLGALAARVHPGLVLAAACWLALCSVPLAFIDAAVRRLPDVLTGAALVGTSLLLLAATAASEHWHVLAQSALGGVALAGFCLVLAVISPSGMGMGDVKAAAGLGTMLAWRGWAALIGGGFAGVSARSRLRHRAPDVRTCHQEAPDPLRPFHDHRGVPGHTRRIPLVGSSTAFARLKAVMVWPRATRCTWGGGGAKRRRLGCCSRRLSPTSAHGWGWTVKAGSCKRLGGLLDVAPRLLRVQITGQNESHPT